MKSLFIISLLFTSVCFAADNPQIEKCLIEAASVSSDSGVEDKMRLSCLKKYQQGLTLSDCKQLKSHIRKQDSDVVADICFEQLKARVEIQECFEVAAWKSDGEARENLSLTCLRENSTAISSMQCFDYAHKVFSDSSRSNTASLICAEGLVPNPIASGNDTTFSIEE